MEIDKKKNVIFIFIGGYLPAKKQGGPVTSIKNFVEHFKDQFEFRIVCSDHEMGTNERYKDIIEGWNKREVEYVYYLRDNEFTTNKFIELMTPYSERILSIYLSGIYFVKMNLPAIRAGKKLNIPIVLAPRGDIMRNSIRMNGPLSACKKNVFLGLSKIIGMFKNVLIQATSEEEAQGAIKYLGLKKENIVLIPNLPIAPVYKDNPQKEVGKIRLLFISRIMVKKNLKHAIEIVAKLPNTVECWFDIYGPIEEEEYWNECKSLINSISSEYKHINYLGSLEPDKAKTIYNKYDALLFPTLSENYGHVIAEALLNDCLAFISRGTTPWDDCESHGVYLGELDETSEFVRKIEMVALMDQNCYLQTLTENRKYLADYLKISEVKDNYMNMFLKL